MAELGPAQNRDFELYEEVHGMMAFRGFSRNKRLWTPIQVDLTFSFEKSGQFGPERWVLARSGDFAKFLPEIKPNCSLFFLDELGI